MKKIKYHKSGENKSNNKVSGSISTMQNSRVVVFCMSGAKTDHIA
jgi:hypothetical protein